MPAVVRLVAALGLALGLAFCLLGAGCGATVDLGGFPPGDAAPEADAASE